MVKVATTEAKVLKVFNQDCTKPPIIQAHVMRTNGGQDMVEYDFHDMALFLTKLDVPHSITEQGIKHFLGNTFSDTATRVFLNWTADGEPDNVKEYWVEDVTLVMKERSEMIQRDIDALTDISLPPGVEKGSAAEAQYHNWMQQNYGAYQQMEG